MERIRKLKRIGAIAVAGVLGMTLSSAAYAWRNDCESELTVCKSMTCLIGNNPGPRFNQEKYDSCVERCEAKREQCDARWEKEEERQRREQERRDR